MKKLAVLIGVIFVLFAVFLVWWSIGIQAVNRKEAGTKIFVIEPGATVREIGNKLKQEGLIRDPVVFFLYIKKQRLDRSIQAGSYKLSPALTLPKLVDNLTHGSIDIWVTFPEGLRAEEISDILEQNFEQFDDSWRAELDKHEGYLFPDTYLIPKDATVETIVTIMRGNFNAKSKELGLPENPQELDRIVSIASLIEREARLPEDRPLVSSVINNRLDIGMKLDIDATIQYALGYQEEEKRWWKRALTKDDLALNSPYNTYRRAGLPPSPISNPGAFSLQAAYNPSNTDYLFYIADSSGKSHFAETIEEHNVNIQKYLR